MSSFVPSPDLDASENVEPHVTLSADNPCRADNLDGGSALTAAMTAPAFAFGDRSWPGLAKLNEECGEIIQEIGKLMMTHGDPAHWSGDIAERLLSEIADVQAAAIFVLNECFSPDQRMKASHRVADKLAKFQHWDRNPGDDPPPQLSEMVA